MDGEDEVKRLPRTESNASLPGYLKPTKAAIGQQPVSADMAMCRRRHGVSEDAKVIFSLITILCSNAL